MCFIKWFLFVDIVLMVVVSFDGNVVLGSDVVRHV